MKIALGVAALGATGSLCRYWLGAFVQRAVPVTGAFPLGTLLINALGSTAIGAVMGFFIARGAQASALRVVLTAGFLGGFTTYSAFAFDTWQLLARRATGLAVLNFAGTSALGLAGCALGVVLGRALAR